MPDAGLCQERAAYHNSAPRTSSGCHVERQAVASHAPAGRWANAASVDVWFGVVRLVQLGILVFGQTLFHRR